MTEHEPKDEKREPDETDDQTASSADADSKEQDKGPKPVRGGAEERNIGG